MTELPQNKLFTTCFYEVSLNPWYRVFHGFWQAKLADGRSILCSQLPQLPLKTMLDLKVVKIDSKIIISLRLPKSVTHSLQSVVLQQQQRSILKRTRNNNNNNNNINNSGNNRNPLLCRARSWHQLLTSTLKHQIAAFILSTVWPFDFDNTTRSFSIGYARNDVTFWV